MCLIIVAVLFVIKKKFILILCVDWNMFLCYNLNKISVYVIVSYSIHHELYCSWKCRFLMMPY